MSFAEIFRQALWPALWPAAIAAAVIGVSRAGFPETLPAVALQFVVGGVVYLAFFLLSIGRAGRREYLGHIDVLLRRRQRQVSPVGTANASLLTSRAMSRQLQYQTGTLIMYERFYQLRERPFALSPDPDYLVSEPRASRGVGLPALRD